MTDAYEDTRKTLKELSEDPDKAFPSDETYKALTKIVETVRKKVLTQQAPERDRRAAIESLIDEALENRQEGNDAS